MRRVRASVRKDIEPKSTPSNRTAPGCLPTSKLPAQSVIPRASAPFCVAQRILSCNGISGNSFISSTSDRLSLEARLSVPRAMRTPLFISSVAGGCVPSMYSFERGHHTQVSLPDAKYASMRSTMDSSTKVLWISKIRLFEGVEAMMRSAGEP